MKISGSYTKFNALSVVQYYSYNYKIFSQVLNNVLWLKTFVMYFWETLYIVVKTDIYSRFTGCFEKMIWGAIYISAEPLILFFIYTVIINSALLEISM